MNPKEMKTLTSSTRTLMPSNQIFQETSPSDQLDVGADQVLQVPFHGLHLTPVQDLLPLLQPACHEGLQGGAAHHGQVELQDCGQTKKSKVINSCAGSVLQDIGP